MEIVILLGAPGSGKGTIASRLAGEDPAVRHVSSGDLLRGAIAAGTPAGVEAKAYMDKGQLVPDALVVDALAIAEQEIGNARTMNMVIAGALSMLSPFKKSAWLKAMAESFTGRKAKLLEINEKAFELGRAAVPGVADAAR